MVFWGTTENKEYIDKEADSVVWSYYIDKEHISEYLNLNSKEMRLPNIYKDVSVFNDAFSYCICICRKLLDYYAQTLNEIHGCDYNSDIWKLGLGMWLFNYVSSLYDKYLNITELESRVDDFYIVAKNRAFVAKDTQEFCIELMSDDLNLSLLAEIMLLRNHKVYDLGGDIVHSLDYDVLGGGICEKKNFTGSNNSSCMMGIISGLLSKVRNIFSNECDTYIISNGYLPLNGLEIYISGGRTRVEPLGIYSITGKCEVDIETRSKLCRLPNTEDDFFNITALLFGKYIPQSMLEYFKQINQIGKEIYVTAKKRIIDGGNIFYNEAFKTYAMTRKSSGCEIYGLQHGGNYGIDNNYLDKYIYDYFYTWGWKYDDPKSIPMPASKLMKYRVKTPKSGKLILYTGNIFENWFCRYTSGIEADHKAYRRIEEDFLLGLPQHIQDRIMCRFFPDYLRHSRENELVKRGLKVSFDDYKKKSLEDRLDDVSLLITNCFQTTWIESIYMGIPTIIVYSEKFMSVLPGTIKYLKMLESVDILFFDTSKAISVVKSIAGKEVEWWNEPRRKEVIKTFKKQFAYHPLFSRLIWFRELCRV